MVLGAFELTLFLKTVFGYIYDRYTLKKNTFFFFYTNTEKKRKQATILADCGCFFYFTKGKNTNQMQKKRAGYEVM